MTDIASPEVVDEVLAALGEHLAAAGERFEIVVVGGSGLLVLGAIERVTRDVDIVALKSGEGLDTADPLPSPLLVAGERVARDFSLESDWLNPGPTDLLDFELPEGFLGRVQTRGYGEGLTVHFASRFDQVHLKLYALVDLGPGKHEADLRALEPSEGELVAAARWARTHDPSEGFEQELRGTLAHLGVEDADLRT
ncbi:MAG TPA: hypothetical protein VGV69_08325 [Solirubrobacterales bacterium]|nr:hypothetical protein [Solirubrobacterales bacterium]